MLAISPIAIRLLDDAGPRRDLQAALAADIVLFTSPNAVRAAAALHALKARRGQVWLAVGAGTRSPALRPRAPLVDRVAALAHGALPGHGARY